MAVKRRRKKRGHARGRTQVNTREMTREQAKHYHSMQRRKTLIRQRRMILGGCAAFLLVVVILVLKGCGTFDKKAKETTLTIAADGSVTFEEVESIGDSTAKELKEYIKDTIKEYNEKKDKKLVSLKKLKAKKDSVYVKTTYKTAESYKDFTGLDLFVGTVSEATQAGYDLSDIYAKVSNGKKGKVMDISDVLSDVNAHLVILDQNINVNLPGAITCVTDEATKVDGQTVTIRPAEEGVAVRTIIFYQQAK